MVALRIENSAALAKDSALIEKHLGKYAIRRKTRLPR